MWYPSYDNTTKDVLCAGCYADPESVEVPEGMTMGSGQTGDIPDDLITYDEEMNAVYNYTYNTETNLVEPKA
jgi:hypothetical protein